MNIEDISIDKIINLDIQINTAISYINKLYNFKTNNEYNLLDLEYKGEKIVKKIQVSLIILKTKIYHNIFVILHIMQFLQDIKI